MEEGFDVAAFQRKVTQLRNHINEGRAVSNIPHGVSDAARRNLTRQYRRAVTRRINEFYKNNPTARANALRRLRESDIDHILDLQLSGPNVRSKLKALHSATNQGLGRQISRQLPNGERIPIIDIIVE